MTGSVILHVVVVGFHHKKGCQVEYAYPPLVDDSLNSLPSEWASLPSLAIPDGAHNAESDVVYFLLPSRNEPGKNVFGISCYRQIDAKELVSRPDDVTRSTVQKSVCVISKIPLFGVLKAKLQLITQAYFNERDFSKIEVLSQMYQNLVDMFEGDLVDGQAPIMDISAKEFIKKFKHRSLLLFKLILLERKVIFNMFPVQILGDSLIALLSLFPRMVEDGLFFATSPCQISGSNDNVMTNSNNKEINIDEGVGDHQASQDDDNAITKDAKDTNDSWSKVVLDDDPLLKIKDDFGFPLSIFTMNNFFHPYVNINFLDTIRSKTARAYTIGATNHLFIQNHNFADAIVTLDDKNNINIELVDSELKKQLVMTTADLRFGDYLLKNIEQNEVLEAAWEGGDEWVRLQFRNYLLSLIASVRSDLQNMITDFGPSFVTAWKKSFNFQSWIALSPRELISIPPGHTFSGQLGVRDIGIFVEHAVQGSGGAKRAMNALSTTGRNLGEAGTKVKESFATWFRGAASAIGQAGGQLSASNSSQNHVATSDEDVIDDAVEARER